MITLMGYMQRIESIYKDTSVKVAKANRKNQKLKLAEQALTADHGIRFPGRKEQLRHFDQEIQHNDELIKDLRSAAKEEAHRIRSEVEHNFYRYYHADPEDLDLKTIKLLESGVLSEEEVLHMASTANVTMRRMFGKYLSSSKQKRYADQGKQMLIASDDPHLRAIDTLISLGDYMVAAKDDSIDWDRLVEPVYQIMPRIGMESLDSGEVRFHEDTQYQN